MVKIGKKLGVFLYSQNNYLYFKNKKSPRKEIKQ